jgi:hypothetical protein
MLKSKRGVERIISHPNKPVNEHDAKHGCVHRSAYHVTNRAQIQLSHHHICTWADNSSLDTTANICNLATYTLRRYAFESQTMIFFAYLIERGKESIEKINLIAVCKRRYL